VALPWEFDDLNRDARTIDVGDADITGSLIGQWDETSSWADVTVNYGIAEGRSGSAQAVQVGGVRSGQVQVERSIDLPGGIVVRGSVWVRGTPGGRIRVAVSQRTAPWDDLAEATIRLDGTWQQASVIGHVETDTPARFVLFMDEPVEVTFDDVQLSATETPVQFTPPDEPLTSELFGMHLGWIVDEELTDPSFEGQPRPVISPTPAVNGDVTGRWLENSDWADVDATYSLDRDRPHSGDQSLRIDLAAVRSGRVQVAHQLVVRSGRHQASVWVRGTEGRQGAITLWSEQVEAESWFTLEDDWQLVEVELEVPDGLDEIWLIVGLNEPGTVWIDDAAVEDADDRPITWSPPPSPGGTLRLWDTATTWARLEPYNDTWEFSLLDKWVELAERSGQRVVLTLGQSPAWASARPDDITWFGPGAPAEPSSLDDWRDYVATVAERYRGRIHAYEIWNEPNDPIFGTASPAALADLTRVADEALADADPAALLVSAPVYSTGFLALMCDAGACNNVDAIGFHLYDDRPERLVADLNAVHLVLADRGITTPVWLTEGASGSNTVDEATNAALLARWHLSAIAAGMDRAWWYTWGVGGDIWGATALPSSLAPNAAHRAFVTLQDWLVGRRVESVNVDTDAVWTMQLDNGDEIVWNPDTWIDAEPRFGIDRVTVNLEGAESTTAVDDITPSPMLVRASGS
jgi:polysaccharide biosynthesis protein PslG